MAGFSLIIHRADLQAMLKRFYAKTGDMTPAMKSFGEYMLMRTDERFSKEQDPQGKPWRRLAAATILAGHRGRVYTRRGRASKGFMRYAEGRQVLTVSHRLRRSVTYKAGRSSLAIGTNVVYGRIHQLGGQAGRGRQVTIPARPFLGFSPADISQAVREVKRFLGFTS